jgi:hypothetical protein
MNKVAHAETKKSFWAYGIIITYACFMTLILTLVFKSTNQKFELVSEDYYQQGSHYQSVINRRTRAQRLPNKPTLNLQSMTLIIPLELQKDFKNAQLSLYRPNDASLDHTRDVHLNSKGQFTLHELKKGCWQISLNWQDSGQNGFLLDWNIIK